MRLQSFSDDDFITAVCPEIANANFRPNVINRVQESHVFTDYLLLERRINIW